MLLAAQLNARVVYPESYRVQERDSRPSFKPCEIVCATRIHTQPMVNDTCTSFAFAANPHILRMTSSPAPARRRERAPEGGGGGGGTMTTTKFLG